MCIGSKMGDVIKKIYQHEGQYILEIKKSHGSKIKCRVKSYSLAMALYRTY